MIKFLINNTIISFFLKKNLNIDGRTIKKNLSEFTCKLSCLIRVPPIITPAAAAKMTTAEKLLLYFG